LRLYVTCTATDIVETRTQTLGNRLNLIEHIRSGREKSLLVRTEAGNRAAGARRAASRTGVNRLLCAGASSPAAASSSVATTTSTAAAPVVWREILGEVFMQIEASAIAILRKSRS
jgi:hypothetical protein